MGDWWCCEADYPNHTKECTMEEGRFVIHETYDVFAEAITESELKHRYLLASQTAIYDHEWPKILHILLHGTEKEQPEPQPRHSVYTRCWACNTWGINLPGITVCGNCGSTYTTEYHPRLDEPLVEPKEQPEPQQKEALKRGEPSVPTRKDFEEWAWDLAGTLSTSVEHRQRINQLLLCMLGVPKE